MKEASKGDAELEGPTRVLFCGPPAFHSARAPFTPAHLRGEGARRGARVEIYGVALTGNLKGVGAEFKSFTSLPLLTSWAAGERGRPGPSSILY